MSPPPRRSIPVLPIVFAGLGVVGFGAAGALSLHLDGRVDDLKASCAPGCLPGDRADLSSELTIANASLVGGAVMLVAAGVSWLLLRPEQTKTTARRVPSPSDPWKPGAI